MLQERLVVIFYTYLHGLKDLQNFQQRNIFSDLLNPVPQDVAVRESGLLNDTEHELDLLDDEDDSNKNTGWTYFKTSLGLNDDEMGMSLELDGLFNKF
jgi:hypothetical protein